MDEELLEILACPKCKGPLQLTPEESELRCEACRLSYRVDDGIPILLLDEASPYE
ncbi:MAG TPA: Trm112 family protein [Candidatus Aquicultoraceae bacterium]|nr:Trm112 family protein [Candidatus Aquicultoraceae bacterium]